MEPKRVLIVAPSAILRKAIKDHLEATGSYQCLLEGLLDQAAIRVNLEKPHAVILDGEMPFQSGPRRMAFDPLDFIRVLTRVHPVPCVFFDESPERREHAERAGACKTFERPQMKSMETLTTWLTEIEAAMK